MGKSVFDFILFPFSPLHVQSHVNIRDGYDMDGSRLRVEISRGRRDQGFGMGGGGFGGRMGMGMGMGRGGFGGMRGGEYPPRVWRSVY